MASNKELYGDFFTKMNLSFDDYFLKIGDFQSQTSIYNTKKLSVHKILEKKTGQVLVAKIYNVDMNKFSKIEKINLPQTLYFMSKLNHPAIIKLVGFSPINFKKQLKPVVIAEIAQNGSLFDLLKKERKSKNHNSKWSPTKKLIAIYGIASSMKYLHSQSILHRNLSPSNILLDDSYYPKLSNFDFLKETAGQPQKEDLEVFGEPEYVAPEVWMRKGYSQASDVYAFSLIVYQILTNEKIYKNKSVNKIMSEVVNKKNRPSFKSPISSCYKNLIKSCWSDDPSKRPSFSDIIEKMKTDTSFILSDVNIDEYMQYVKLIDDSQCTESQPNKIEANEINNNNDDDNDSQFKNQQSDKIKVEENEIINDDSNEKNSENEKIKVEEFDSNVDVAENIFLDISKYAKLKEIGRGSTGSVFAIKDKETGNFFAAKVLKKETDEFTESKLRNLYREINLMFHINHPAVLNAIGLSLVNFVNKPKPTIVCDLMKGSLYNLLSLVRKGSALSEWNNEKKLIMIFGIAHGMSYLNKHYILHRDLKPENILIDEYLHPKICDYINLTDSNSLNLASTTYMTPMYMAPEVFEDDTGFSEKSDVYSFALICYEILTGKIPYERKTMFQIMRYVVQGGRPAFDSSIPSTLQDFISRCWSNESELRPSFKEIVNYLKDPDNYCEFLGEDCDDDEYIKYINYIENNSTTNDPEQLFTKVNIDFLSRAKEEDKSDKQDSTEFDNNQTIDLRNFEKKDKIGKGAFANVYSVIDKKTSKIYAAKILNNELCDLSQKEQLNFSRELKILSKLHYESVVKFIGYSPRNFKGNSKSVFIIELASNGSLEDTLELERKGCSVPNWDETKKLINIFGIASGMKYMHSISILHRDLKPENILLDDDLYPKISDFGLSKDIKTDTHLSNYIMGTLYYIAPEIWSDYEYTEAVDVYAFAMIVYEIVTGERPLTEFKLRQQIAYKITGKRYRPSFKYSIPDCYRNLIEKCWSSDPQERPTFSQIVSMLKEDPEFVESVDLDEFIIYTEQIGDSYLMKDQLQNQQQLKSKSVNSQKTKTNQNKIVEIVKEEKNKMIQKIIESEISKNIIHDLSKYEQKEIICKEEFTKTVKIIDKETGKSFSARISNIDMNQFSEEEMNQIYDEMSKITHLNHPSILKIIGFSPFGFKKEPKPVIVTEFTSPRTLQDIFNMKNSGIPLSNWNSTKKLICIYGLASAMKYLHSNEILHRQLTPKNILIDQYFQPKLRNFGICTHLINLTSMSSMSSSKIQNAYVYSAPEILCFEEFIKPSDVYSFAFIIYEIITDKKPFYDLKDYSSVYKEVVTKGNRPNISNQIPKCYKEMIEKCWSQNPKDRHSFIEIIDNLENDPDFITLDTDKNEYCEYIKMLKKSKS